MTESTNAKPASKSTPSYIAYHVRDVTGDKGFWTRIGSAWPHKDAKGFNIQIDIIPLDGRIALRLASEKND